MLRPVFAHALHVLLDPRLRRVRERRAVGRIARHQRLRGDEDFADEHVEEVDGHALADHNSEDLDGFDGWGEGVVWGM